MPVRLSQNRCCLSLSLANLFRKGYFSYIRSVRKVCASEVGMFEKVREVGCIMIVLEKVNKFILQDISIYIPKGEIIGLLGPSGAGKTTFLKLASGLLEPEKGYVRVMGKEPVQNDFLKRKRVAFFAETPFLCRGDTVKESFRELKAVYHLSEAGFWRGYRELADRLDFGKFEEERLSALSLGQRMRAELGAALLLRPELLLLDEPTVGLDANGKAALREILLESVSEGRTVLITSHDIAEISKLCNRIAVLNEGKLVYYGSEERLQKCVVPVETMTVRLSGRYPDLEDLPLTSYFLDGDKLVLHYNSSYITAAEILRLLLSQTEIAEVKISKPGLEHIILELEMEENYV